MNARAALVLALAAGLLAAPVGAMASAMASETASGVDSEAAIETAHEAGSTDGIAGLSVTPDAFLLCTSCHGTQLRGDEGVGAPRLSGLSSWYVRNQLEAFRAGWRGTHADSAGFGMHLQSRALTDAEIEAAAAWVSRTTSPLPARTLDGDPARGEALYSTCAACHGAGGEGTAALAAPRLAGHNDWYLLRQLRDYAAGVRGAAADDLRGAQMRAALTTLPDEAARADVIAYIATLTDRTTTEEKSTVKKPMLAGALAAGLLATAADAEVTRHPLPDSDFPISQAVEITADTALVFHSGMTPRPADPDAERFSPAFWGDTEAQALSVFSRLEESLKAKGLSFADVIKMQVYLVGVPELEGAMDFQGMMRAYRRYFGTDAQPNLPARSAFQVAGLAAPGMLVEIEVVLARP